MMRLDQPLEPQEVLDRAERVISLLQTNPASLSAEERQGTLEALIEVQKYTTSELMRQQALQKERVLSNL